MDAPRRRPPPRLKGFDYRTATAYFVTLGTKHRTPQLARVNGGRVVLTPLGGIVQRHLDALPERHPGLVLDTVVIMPDHLHAIVWLPPRGGRALSQIVGLFKAGCSRDAASILRFDRRLWQRSFHDRVIRTDRELHLVRRYVVENPRRWTPAIPNPGGPDESGPYGESGS